jgi:DNA invertase Pin-like site-specific DNA recombinase
MTLLGYARVSTSRQKLDAQIDALTAAGVAPEHIWTDKRSGAADDRQGLAALLAYAREGDTVVVWRLDRLGRSLSHVVRTAGELHAKGIAIKGLNDGVDYSTPSGRMVAAILAALAEYERTLINERAEAAREAARARGAAVGRPRVISADQLRSVRALRAAGESMASICSTLNLKRATVYKALAEAGEPE